MADSMDELAGILLTMLQDKKAVIGSVIDNLQQVGTIKKGTERLQEILEENRKEQIRNRDEDSNVDYGKAVTALAKSVNKLSQSTEQLLVFALLYVSEGSFDVDSALMMTKLGRGQEALKQMWKNKTGDQT